MGLVEQRMLSEWIPEYCLFTASMNEYEFHFLFGAHYQINIHRGQKDEITQCKDTLPFAERF